MCALSTCTSHAHILYLSKGHNPDEIRALSWNIMGDTHEGWATVRSVIVHPNIQGYDIVFLQEVQWVEDGTKKRLATPGYDPILKKSKDKSSTPLFEVALTRSNGDDRNICILYKPDRLQCEDASAVTQTLRSVAGWKDEYSERLCVQVFTLKGKGDTSKFVAISLHAPKYAENKPVCDLVKAFIEDVVTVHRLPVLVGGDFNSDIRHWNENHGDFLGLDYEGCNPKPIDFIVMKVPRIMEMAKVQKMECHKITITNAEDIEVKLKDETIMTVAECKERSTANFSKHLCGSHMPLTVVVKYSPNAIQSEGSKQESMSWEKLKAENAKLKMQIQEMTVENKKVKERHQAEIASLKKQHKEEIDSLKVRLPSPKTSKKGPTTKAK